GVRRLDGDRYAPLPLRTIHELAALLLVPANTHVVAGRGAASRGVRGEESGSLPLDGRGDRYVIHTFPKNLQLAVSGRQVRRRQEVDLTLRSIEERRVVISAAGADAYTNAPERLRQRQCLGIRRC